MRAGSGQMRSSGQLGSAWKWAALAGGWSVCLIAPAAGGGYADQYGSGGYGSTSRYGNYSDQYGARTPTEDQGGQGYADQFSGRPFQPPPPPPPRGPETATTSTDAPSLGALDPMKGLWTGFENPAGGPARPGSNATQTPSGGVDLSYGLSGAPAGAANGSSVGDGLLEGLTSNPPTNAETATAPGSRERDRASTDQRPQSGFADQYVSRSQNAPGKEPSLFGSPTPPPQANHPWSGPDTPVAHAPPVEDQGPLQALKDVFHNAKAALRAGKRQRVGAQAQLGTRYFVGSSALPSFLSSKWS